MTIDPASAPSNVSGDAPRIWALVPCAGTGSRAGSSVPKQYQSVAGSPMVMHTLAAFSEVACIANTLVVVAAEDRFFDVLHMPALTGPALPELPELPRASFIVANCGGSTRATSVFNGLNHLIGLAADPRDWVLVHDAARCLITPAQINALIDACLADEVGGLLAHKLPDTLKSESNGRVARTLNRSDKWLAQTPQMFRIGPLLAALARAGDQVTDESSAMEAMGFKPKLVAGSAQNFKVTYWEDFCLAEAVIQARQHVHTRYLVPDTRYPIPGTRRSHKAITAAAQLLQRHYRDSKNMTTPDPATLVPNMPKPPAMPRIGEGWDIHALAPDRQLIIGGVHIPFQLGLLGHSDADVLLHAITDALFGAAALGDIGTHFPDTDGQFKGADSIVLLAEAARRVRAQGFEIGNVDSTVIAQAPRLAPHIAGMRLGIAQALGVQVNQVNVKAKTAEKLGPVGQGLAMEARAIVMIW